MAVLALLTSHREATAASSADFVEGAAQACVEAVMSAEVSDAFAPGPIHPSPNFHAAKAIELCKRAVAQDVEDFMVPGLLAEAFALAGDIKSATRVRAYEVARFGGMGSGVFSRHPELIQQLRNLAESEAEARVALAFLYLQGSGVEKDEDQALSLFEDAARAGDPEGQFRFGMHLLELARAKSEDARAETWNREGESMLRAAAAQCHPRAGRELAISVDGLSEDEALMQYALLDARRGNKTAQLMLSTYYVSGKHTERSPVDAYAWILMAVERWPLLQDVVQMQEARLGGGELLAADKLVEEIKASMCPEIGLRSTLNTK